MIHLKRFNESKEDYYKEVGDEWADFVGINISDKIFTKIESLLDEDKYTLKLSDCVNNDGSDFYGIDILDERNNIFVEIFQADDDWFWVAVLGRHDYAVLGRHDYYKCDQDTGLIMLLKDKGII